MFVSSSPKYNNYHSDPFYLSGIKQNPDTYFYLNFPTRSYSLPVKKNTVFGSYNDLLCPIGFQATLGDNSFWQETLSTMMPELKKHQFVSLYILLKDHISFSHKLSQFDTYRTNYFFDLEQSTETLWIGMKRDCKSRLKRALRSTKHKVVYQSDLVEFHNHYDSISQKNCFSDFYKFDLSNFRQMNQAKDILYLELTTEENIFISGGIFGLWENSVDYLFGANNELFDDSIRMLIWEAVNYFKNRGFGYLYLGGGISEEDSLANFKKRFGTFEKKCSIFKSIINLEIVEKLMDSKYSDTWFDGFFPPYNCKES